MYVDLLILFRSDFLNRDEAVTVRDAMVVIVAAQVMWLEAVRVPAQVIRSGWAPWQIALFDWIPLLTLGPTVALVLFFDARAIAERTRADDEVF